MSHGSYKKYIFALYLLYAQRMINEFAVDIKIAVKESNLANDGRGAQKLLTKIRLICHKIINKKFFNHFCL